jgi:hypothetical protein
LRIGRSSSVGMLRDAIAAQLSLAPNAFKMRRSKGGTELKDAATTLEQLEFTDGSVRVCGGEDCQNSQFLWSNPNIGSHICFN